MWQQLIGGGSVMKCCARVCTGCCCFVHFYIHIGVGGWMDNRFEWGRWGTGVDERCSHAGCCWGWQMFHPPTPTSTSPTRACRHGRLFHPHTQIPLEDHHLPASPRHFCNGHSIRSLQHLQQQQLLIKTTNRLPHQPGGCWVGGNRCKRRYTFVRFNRRSAAINHRIIIASKRSNSTTAIRLGRPRERRKSSQWLNAQFSWRKLAMQSVSFRNVGPRWLLADAARRLDGRRNLVEYVEMRWWRRDDDCCDWSRRAPCKEGRRSHSPSFSSSFDNLSSLLRHPLVFLLVYWPQGNGAAVAPVQATTTTFRSRANGWGAFAADGTSEPAADKPQQRGERENRVDCCAAFVMAPLWGHATAKNIEQERRGASPHPSRLHICSSAADNVYRWISNKKKERTWCQASVGGNHQELFPLSWLVSLLSFRVYFFFFSKCEGTANESHIPFFFIKTNLI